MPIKLDWIDHNGTADSRKVYRSLTKIDQGNLGVPFATLPGNALTYTDTTVQRGVTYHYVVTSVVGTDEAPSAEYVIAYIPYTGPGPQTLIRGNWEYGYFGRVPLEDIFSAGELCNLCGITAATGTPDLSAGNYWHKIVYKGKILFYPNGKIAASVTPLTLYQLGLLYGPRPSSEWPAAVKTQYGIIDQSKMLNSGNHKFYVRAPTSRSNMLSTSTAVADLRGGEIDTVFSGVYLNRDFNVNNTPAMDDSVAVINLGHYIITADYYSGSGAAINNVFRGCSSSAAGNIDLLQPAYGFNAVSAAVVWRPVLELVT